LVRTLLLTFLFVFVSCAHKGRKERNQIRELVLKNDYPGAFKVLSESEDLREDRSRLLFVMEAGKLKHLEGNWEESNIYFIEASQLIDILYTKSVTAKAQTWLINDSNDIYYGASFERSMVHYYKTLNHYKIFLKNNDRSQLFAARAEVVAWNFFLRVLKEDKRGESVFKDDILAKVIGAQIHEAIDTREDLFIALQLYKDADHILFRNLNGLKSFNNKFIEFKKDFLKLPDIPLEKVRQDYVAATWLNSSLHEYLSQKILDFQTMLRPQDLKMTKKQFSISNDLKAQKKSNVSFVLERGLIPEKTPDEFYFGLEKAIQDPNSGAVARFGAQVIGLFAAEKLGLLPPANGRNPVGAYLGLSVGTIAASTVAISFELPKATASPVSEKLRLKIFDSAGAEAFSKDITILQTMGDVAEEAIAEDSAWRYTRVGARLAVKHVLAIASAFGTYKLVAGSNGANSFLARNLAVIEYIGASKLIAESEKADLRYWSTLPNEIQVTDFFLPPGKYSSKIETLAINGEKISVNDGPSFDIAEKTSKQIFCLKY
jgi:hypothetical protein